MKSYTILFLFLLLSTGSLFAQKKHIVLIAGMKSHGEEANGIHDYPWDARLLKTALERSNKDELLDLIAYLVTGGNVEHPLFEQNE